MGSARWCRHPAPFLCAMAASSARDAPEPAASAAPGAPQPASEAYDCGSIAENFCSLEDSAPVEQLRRALTPHNHQIWYIQQWTRFVRTLFHIPYPVRRAKNRKHARQARSYREYVSGSPGPSTAGPAPFLCAMAASTHSAAMPAEPRPPVPSGLSAQARADAKYHD